MLFTIPALQGKNVDGHKKDSNTERKTVKQPAETSGQRQKHASSKMIAKEEKRPVTHKVE